MRQRYPTQRILLRGGQQKEFACIKIRNAPLDEDSPLEVLIREYRPTRSLDQNAMMWSGPLSDISHQVYLEGRTYSPEAWHEYFKEQFLPEEFDDEQCRPGYRKWIYLPNGDRRLVGSSTQLTKKGFSLYLEKIYAFGAEQGVLFGVKE